MMINFAMISPPSNVVINISYSDLTIQELADLLPAYIVVELTGAVRCAIGDYYNTADGLFYIDPDFVWLSGTTPPPSLEDAYNAALKNIRENGNAALISINPPYSEQEAVTWWAQSEEAKLWTSDNSYVPEMLNAIVTASNGAYTLSSLVSETLDNISSWKVSAGSVIGQVKYKTDQLNALKDEVIAGTKNVMDIVNLNTEIIVP
ncbi:TPA: hypothetical protein QHN14_003347 [Enterobacter roggenkampii]|nr:hypothetical protein [Enterobacter roggenkampii]